MAAMVTWFPVAGLVIGALVGGIAAGMWELSTPMVAGAVAVTGGLLVTGAFHEDGLADVADAFGGGLTIERRLEILKDPRHGTYGVASMCASIVVRVVALGSLPGPAVMFASCVAAHVVARSVAVALMATVPLATHSGLGADYGRSTTGGRAAIAGLAGLAVALAAVGWWVAPVAGVALIGAAAVGLLARRKIGGISGDVLGAAEQVAECATLVTIAALAAHHPLWWS
jgi:adenosylcobinamide-GDP ribazoletransferase